MKTEVRFCTNEVRIVEDGESSRLISGYAAVFNQRTRLSERLEEVIAPGAFTSSLKNDVRALWSHNPDMVIGRSTNGSLVLGEDHHGLNFSLKLPDTTQGRDAYTLIKGGYVTGVSFGFRVKKDSWERGSEGSPHVRTLLDVDLIEISPTPFPAYPQTSVSARSVDEMLKEKESEWLWTEKQKGFPVDEAKRNLELLMARAAITDLLH